MPENDRLNSCLDEINLEFVEREATPRLLMKLSIQLHLSGLSLSNTISFLEVFVSYVLDRRYRSGVHKADLQSKDGRSSDHIAANKTIIQLSAGRC